MAMAKRRRPAKRWGGDKQNPGGTEQAASMGKKNSRELAMASTDGARQRKRRHPKLGTGHLLTHSLNITCNEAQASWRTLRVLTLKRLAKAKAAVAPKTGRGPGAG